MKSRSNDAVHDSHEQAGSEPPRDVAGANETLSPDLPAIRGALDAGRIGTWSWDIGSDTVRWSHNMEEIHDLPPSTFDGTFAAFQRDIHPDDQAEVQAAIRESVHSGKDYHVQYRLAPRPDRDDRWVEAAGRIIDDGSTKRLLGICRDVTDRVRLLRELRARARQQEAVARISERALTEVDLQKLFEELVAMVAEILDVEFIKVLELVPGDAELLLRARRRC